MCVGGRPDQCFIEAVEDRKRQTLFKVIERRIAPGKTVCSNGWKAYKDLTDLIPEKDFKDHKVVNHSVNFVNPLDPDSHTQNIESFWSVFKRRIRKLGYRKMKENIEEHF